MSNVTPSVAAVAQSMAAAAQQTQAPQTQTPQAQTQSPQTTPQSTRSPVRNPVAIPSIPSLPWLSAIATFMAVLFLIKWCILLTMLYVPVPWQHIQIFVGAGTTAAMLWHIKDGKDWNLTIWLWLLMAGIVAADITRGV
jgi:hypothetical protein